MSAFAQQYQSTSREVRDGRGHSDAISGANGFTLLELIVVIGILLLLAGILLPLLSSTRNAARAASCMNNMRQISLAILLYSQDNSDRLPYTKGASANPNLQLIGQQVPWAPTRVFAVPGDNNPAAFPWSDLELWNALFPYLKEPAIWFCPSLPRDARAHYTPAADAKGDWTYERIGTTYIYNLFTRQYPGGQPRPGIVIPHQVALSSMSARLAEAPLLWEDPCATHGPTGAAPNPQVLEPWLEPPHNNGMNVAYADGHVARGVLSDQTDSGNNVIAATVFNTPANLEAGWVR